MAKTWKIPGLILLVGAVTLTGCSRGVNRSVDVSQGDYYTEEEFKNLSSEQRDAYCQGLAAELESLEGQAQEARAEARANQNELAAKREEARRLKERADALDSEVSALQKQIDELESLPKSYTVVKGDFLYRISEYPYIYSDPLKWPRIYRANRSVIGEDPNLIYPDQVFTIPRDWPDNHTVVQDEYLSRIASYWEVYDDPMQWPKLYEANKDQISDPDLIYPEQTLKIPR
jgi:nucleoid-associated protein YgaU